MELFSLFGSLLLLCPFVCADGLYSKTSPVLQVDARSYTKLIEKSNYTSIVEFYAPWCGHCKNLKSDFEKAARSLAGSAKVAAVNCDDDSNKAFCGSMGVQGFPTLKIVKPRKKGGKPVVSDYNGERTAKAIKESIEDKIPNHVTKLTDKNLDEWLARDDRPKAVFFTEKAAISPMVKGIAIDFLGVMDVAQARSTEKQVVGRFTVDGFPRAFLMSSGAHVPTQYTGELKREALLDFFTTTGAITPNPEWPKAGSKERPVRPKSSMKRASGPGKPTKVPRPTAASETLEEQGPPTDSPSPNVQQEKPVEVPIEQAEPAGRAEVRHLATEDELCEACLTTKSTTCVLAITTEAGSDQSDAASSFAVGIERIAHKSRTSRKFPIYAVPSANRLGSSLLSSLGVDGSGKPTVIAMNAKRSWWAHFEAKGGSPDELADWIDGIKLGDFKKLPLPALDLKTVAEETKQTAKDSLAREEGSDHDEL